MNTVTINKPRQFYRKYNDSECHSPMHDSVGEYCPICLGTARPREVWKPLVLVREGIRYATFAHKRCLTRQLKKWGER